jgi:hypothetical protein
MPAPGCEKKPGLDSRPANKLMAICIPFRDSAVLYERIHCVRSRRLGSLKGEPAEKAEEIIKPFRSRHKAAEPRQLLLCRK